MRIVGLDIGQRRVGFAISDPSRTLARPVGVIRVKALDDVALDRIVEEIQRLSAIDDEVSSIVVGFPRRLDGTPNEMTAVVQRLALQLEQRMRMPVALQDERLSSVEAESRLATRDKDWRARKEKIDAAAAAIVLQDYLDGAVRPNHTDDPGAA